MEYWEARGCLRSLLTLRCLSLHPHELVLELLHIRDHLDTLTAVVVRRFVDPQSTVLLVHEHLLIRR